MNSKRTGTGVSGRKPGAFAPEALPVCFVIRIKGDASLIIQREWEKTLLSSEILTAEPDDRLIVSGALSGGRGSAVCIKLPEIGTVVLRRYRRGGLIGKFLVDRYLSSSRPFRELDVLAFAHARGVPVPEVAGASSIRAGLLWHRGRIVTRLIADSVTLPVFIEKNRDGDRRLETVLKKAGAAIRLMHDTGIDHADLNMNNILVDKKGAAYIIDFDKAKIRTELAKWRRFGNLRRLLRSLRKLKAAGRGLEERDYVMIINGYAGDDRALVSLVERKTLGSRLLALRSALGRIL